MRVPDLRIIGHDGGQTLKCTACGALIETGKMTNTLGELARLSLQITHAESCVRDRFVDPDPSGFDSNSTVRQYRDTDDCEVVGSCHPMAGVNVRLNMHGAPVGNVGLECRHCRAPVASLNYRQQPLGPDDPSHWVCPCGTGEMFGGDPSDPSLAFSQCRHCGRPITEFLRATMVACFTVRGLPAPRPKVEVVEGGSTMLTENEPKPPSKVSIFAFCAAAASLGIVLAALLHGCPQ